MRRGLPGGDLIDTNDKLVVDSKMISVISFSCKEIKDGLYKLFKCITGLKENYK